MKDINWAVKIHNIDASSTNPSKGLYYETSEYLFKWSLHSATNYLDGLLLEKWASGFSMSVDIKRNGKFATIGGGSIYLDNTTDFFIWLESQAYSIKGRKIELIEIDPTDDSETILYTGVVGRSIKHDGKTITIPFEDITRTRNAKISPAISGKDNQYYPAVFGEVEKTKFVNETDTAEEVEFDNGKMVFQVTANFSSSEATVGVKFRIKPSSEDGLTANDQTLLNQIDQDDELYLKVVSGEGEGELRKFFTWIQYDVSGQLFDLELDESTYVDGTTTSWVPNETYVKFYRINYTNTADVWSNYQGFQDDLLYTYPNDRYVTIPLNNGNFRRSQNKVELIADDLKDWGKISGFEILQPTNVTEGQDTGITAPDDLDGIASNTYTYFSTSKVWAANFTGGTPTDSGVPNADAVKDKDGSTFSLANLTPDAAVDDFVMVDVKKLSFEPFEADEVYLAGYFRYENNGSGNFEQTCYLYVNVKNNFENSNIRTLQLSYVPGTNKVRYLNNYDENYLSNFNPSTEVDSNYDQNRTWWRNTVEGSDSGAADTNWAVGYDLVELDIASSPNPLIQDIPEIFVTNYIYLNGPTNPSYDIELKTYQYSLIAKIDDIDFTKGIYAKWWGRNFDTTDFGTGANVLMQFGNDIYNHVCRLQNYSVNSLTPPSSGWGIDYYDNSANAYDSVIDNSTNYGGLKYTELDLYPIMDRQINKSTDLDTIKIKDTLLKDNWAFGAVDYSGKEKIFPMAKAFDDAMSRVSINYNDYKESSINLTDRTIIDVFCQPYVNYAWDEAQQKYTKEIRITNTEQSSYNPATDDYVTGEGLSDSQKTALWTRAKYLYDNYKIVNDPPENITKLPWISRTVRANDFLLSWLDWMGGTSEGFKDRRTIEFTVSYEFAVSNSLSIGSLITVSLPHEDSDTSVYGVITGINHNLKQENPECKIKAFVEVDAATATGENIDESGSRADNIDESGSRTDDVDETGDR